MKRITLLSITIFLLSFSSKAGDTTRFYAMPHLNLVPKTGQTAITLGLDAAYSPLYRFFVGASYQQIVNKFMPLTEKDNRKELTSRWGGLLFNYQLKNNEFYKIYTHLGVGRGVLDIIIDEEGALPDERELYSYLQTGINFDVLISQSFSFSMGWQYRFVSEIDYKNVSSSDIAGISGQIGIRYMLNK